MVSLIDQDVGRVVQKLKEFGIEKNTLVIFSSDIGTKASLEVYDLKTDPREQTNIAATQVEIVAKLEAILAAEHTPSPHYTTPESGNAGEKAMKGQKAKTAGNVKNVTLEALLDDEE